MGKRVQARSVLVALMLISLVTGLGALQAFAIDLGDIVKVGGIGYLVQQFGPDINKAINAAYGRNNVDPYDATKVVPIVSFGSGGYVGAAQVQGPQKAVEKVKGVAQIEVNFFHKSFKVRALVPVDTLSVGKMNRVKGTGVSAEIAVKI